MLKVPQVGVVGQGGADSAGVVEEIHLHTVQVEGQTRPVFRSHDVDVEMLKRSEGLLSIASRGIRVSNGENILHFFHLRRCVGGSGCVDAFERRPPPHV